MSGGPYFDELRGGQVFDTAPSITLPVAGTIMLLSFLAPGGALRLRAPP